MCFSSSFSLFVTLYTHRALYLTLYDLIYQNENTNSILAIGFNKVDKISFAWHTHE